LVGGPSWITSDRFDIVAKSDSSSNSGATGSPDPNQLAMRTLLADRFGLKTHRETREMDVYALAMVRPGAPGPALTAISTECAAVIKAGPSAHGRTSGPPAPTNGQPCGGIGIGTGVIRFGGFPISQLLPLLGERTGRIVVDRTGLAGRWQFELRFAPDQRGQSTPEATTPATDSEMPSLFTALREQLGLELESTKGAVEVLAIDHVERPTPE